MGDSFTFERPAWQKRAKCRGMNPEIFFPKRGDSLEPAKAICATCPVQGPCRMQSIEFNEYNGVWGGEGREGRKRQIHQLIASGKIDRRRVGCKKSD